VQSQRKEHIDSASQAGFPTDVVNIASCEPNTARKQEITETRPQGPVPVILKKG
jgi:hypothetical protein